MVIRADVGCFYNENTHLKFYFVSDFTNVASHPDVVDLIPPLAESSTIAPAIFIAHDNGSRNCSNIVRLFVTREYSLGKRLENAYFH